MLSMEYIPYNRANEHTFREVFYPEEHRGGIFSIEETLSVMEGIVEKVNARHTINTHLVDRYSRPPRLIDRLFERVCVCVQYYTFPDFSVERYDHLKDPMTSEPEPPILLVKRYKSLTGPFWNHSLSTEHNLDDRDINGDFATFDGTSQEASIEYLNPQIVLLNDYHVSCIESNRIESNQTLDATEYYKLPRENPLAAIFSTSASSDVSVQNEFYQVVNMQLSFSFRGVNIGAFAVVPTIWRVNVW